MSNSRKKKNDTEAVVAEAMREVNMAMREVAQATAPLRKMSNKNLHDIESDSLPYHEPVSSEPKIETKGGAIQIKKPGLFGNSSTTINIQSAQNIQIGNNNTMIINSSSTRRRTRDISPPPKPAKVNKEIVKQVLESKRLLDDMELNMVAAKFMGKQWRRTLRLVGLEDIEIESKYQDYYSQGIKEISYQCLKYWKQKNPDTATVGHIAKALSEVFHPDEVCDKFKP
ncbi:unnamed protein product [Mytilus coruscus]|uniref:Death domain-containing protein n=1 Tax=Mytilus coruscus TaxID=42192 RepID=A0A6J8E815_MYTCO|nr:unnamed protein product [Mytilus coruscus]